MKTNDLNVLSREIRRRNARLVALRAREGDSPAARELESFIQWGSRFVRQDLEEPYRRQEVAREA